MIGRRIVWRPDVRVAGAVRGELRGTPGEYLIRPATGCELVALVYVLASTELGRAPLCHPLGRYANVGEAERFAARHAVALVDILARNTAREDVA